MKLRSRGDLSNYYLGNSPELCNRRQSQSTGWSWFPHQAQESAQVLELLHADVGVKVRLISST